MIRVIPGANTRYQIAKRLFDVVVCLLVLPFALVLIAVLALAVVLDSPGPAFLIQERVGKDGKRFRMLKFRTLRADHDNQQDRQFMRAFINGEIQKSGHQPDKVLFKPFSSDQITYVGSLLRKTSLDELPQIFNVLSGEMSLVGPRPNVPWEVEMYKNWHLQRLAVLPGITGLAQVRGRSGIPFDAIVKYDLEYINNQSFKLDLQIIWWTVVSALNGHGAG